MSLGETSIKTVFEEIRRQTNKIVIYNDDRLALRQKVKADFKDMELSAVLDRILAGSGMTYKFVDDYIVITPAAGVARDSVKSVRVKGWVYDENKEILPGVTVKVVGVPLGTSTNAKGWFAIDLPIQKGKLEFSFVGYKKKQIDFSEKTDTLRIVMEEDLQQVEEVVVTGIFNKPKESFTGAVTAITKEDIKMNYSRNILQTLANIDPSLRIIQNNEAGSNPNVLPEIQLRGSSTMLDYADLEMQRKRPEYNQPLFIMDGFEVDLERVQDLNENEIENVTILKDASATSLYGSRGANGVIVITTTLAKAGRLSVMYEGRVNLEIPDFSTYDNLMTAKEKFEIEKEYGVWDNTLLYQEMYDQITDAVDRGVNFNWLKVPTRTGVGQTHILRFMGGQEAWTYSIDLSYRDVQGAMKESDRKNFNGTMNIGYQMKKWNVRQSLSVGINRNQDSPYGDFSNFVVMNRYWEPFDENGKPVEYYYHPTSMLYPMNNPIYDKEVGVWNKSKYTNLRSNTQVRFDIMPNLQSSITFGVNNKTTTSDMFYPPNHKNFNQITDIKHKGSFTRGERESTEWQLRGMLNYANTFADKHMLTVGASAEISELVEDYVNWTTEGFTTSNVSHPGMSMGYPTTRGTMGTKNKSRRVSTSVSVNYYLDQRYFMDASITYNGSSSFGKNSRFSPYYSIGGGWLVSNESFMQNNLPFINNLRLRYSVGITGNMAFAPEISMEIFKRGDYTYLGGIGWKLSSFANPDLKQQNTIQHNVGFDLGLFYNRVTVMFNYYSKMTNNTLTDINLPASHGFPIVKGNVGKIRNEGYEWYVTCNLYTNTSKKMKWLVSANFSRNKNTIVKLSEGFKERMFYQFKYMSTAIDYAKYKEGHSLDAIYGLRTVGIDPTSGQRVFLKKDGVTTTLEQNADDLVALGDRQPKVNGTISTSFTWNGFSLIVGFGVRWGGKQLNTTELNRGENVFLIQNLDRRILKYGWFKSGDQARYKNQSKDYSRIMTYACDAFVHKDNVFSCNNINVSYRFTQDWLKRMGIENLSVSTSLSDIFYISTIERERGINYPFSINPNFSISCTF